MSTTPNYAATPKGVPVLISAANTNRDGTGTIVNVMTGAAAGSRIDRVTIKARGTTTDGMVRLFLWDGTTAFLLTEIPVTAITPSSTVASFETTVEFDGGILLGSTSHALRASTHNAESFNVIAFGGDF